MKKQPLTVTIFAKVYTFVDSPDKLYSADGERLAALIDHEQCIVWIDATLTPSNRLRTMLQAVSQGWDEALAGVEIVE